MKNLSVLLVSAVLLAAPSQAAEVKPGAKTDILTDATTLSAKCGSQLSKCRGRIRI